MMTAPRYQLLFICTGNICRSPMAEYLLRHQLGPQTLWQVRSAGLAALDGQPASQLAIATLDEIGLDLTPHRSRNLTQAMLDAVPLIVVMTASHMQELQRRFPAARDRAYLLSSFDPAGNNRDIADPIGFNMAIYRQTCAAIDAFLPDLILYLKEYEIRTQ